MIIANLKGGLGNQMFQIAAGYALARRVGTDFSINYNLKHNCIQGKSPERYRDNLFKNIPSTDYMPAGRYSEPAFSYNAIDKNKDLIIDGYFQSDRYFEDFEDDVKNLFYFPDEVKEKYAKLRSRIDADDLIGIHVRRGDYKVYSTTHPVQPKKYYMDAYNTIYKGQPIIVTSDDWASVYADNILDDDIEWHSTQGCSEIEDLYILSQCNSVIMSNSSFAWWGAYLGKPKNIVIAPKSWFGPDGPQDYQDIYNPTWIKL